MPSDGCPLKYQAMGGLFVCRFQSVLCFVPNLRQTPYGIRELTALYQMLLLLRQDVQVFWFDQAVLLHPVF